MDDEAKEILSRSLVHQIERLRAELDDANDQIERMQGLIETAEQSTQQAYLLWSDEVERRGTVEAERDALRAQLDEAGKALKPLAVALTRAEKVYGATAEDGWSVANTTVAQIVTYGDLRRARAVYEKIKGGTNEG